MRTIIDKDLGEIKVRSVHQARHIRFKISPKGELVVTAPPLTPIFVIKQAIRTSKSQLQDMLTNHQRVQMYRDGQTIGHSHRLAVVETTMHDQPRIKTTDRVILLSVQPGTDISLAPIQRVIQTEVIRVMKKEAKAYLGKRLARLAQRHGFSYSKIRYTHTGTRWGSCSSQGTISLNIALMKLPLELIDYVLIHELCHTQEMNHSSAFWALVQSCSPDYRDLRRRLKAEMPSL